MLRGCVKVKDRLVPTGLGVGTKVTEQFIDEVMFEAIEVAVIV